MGGANYCGLTITGIVETKAAFENAALAALAAQDEVATTAAGPLLAAAQENAKEATLRQPPLASSAGSSAEPNESSVRYPGLLADSMIIDKPVTVDYGGQTWHSVQVGPTQMGWYGRLVEWGHNIVPKGQTAKKMSDAAKASLTQVQPHPWLTPARDNTQTEVETAIIDGIGQAIVDGFNAG